MHVRCYVLELLLMNLLYVVSDATSARKLGQSVLSDSKHDSHRRIPTSRELSTLEVMSLQIPANHVPEPERLVDEKPVKTVHTKVDTKPADHPKPNPKPQTSNL